MKYLYSLFFLLFISLSSYAQLKSAIILDPEGWSQQVDVARFENIKITIEPKGAFANVELEMEVKPQDYRLHSDQQLELEYFFNLPQGSIIHEAYLWMEGQAVKAQLYERQEAMVIYESYVNRRTDPLIIYKDGNHYEARIYPFIKDENRKFKINFLMPVSITQSAIEIDLPFNLFESHIAASGDVTLTVSESSMWGLPNSFNTLPFTSNGGLSTIKIPHSDVLLGDSRLTFSKISNMDKLYTQETSAGEGYFHLILNDTLVHPKLDSSKYIFVFDIESRANELSRAKLCQILKKEMHQTLSPRSKFKVLYKDINLITDDNNTWINGDSLSIETTMTKIQLSELNIRNNQGTDLKTFLLHASQEMLTENDVNARIMLYSNSFPLGYSYESSAVKDSVIHSIPSGTSFHIADLSMASAFYHSNSGSTMNNNELFTDLANATNGSYHYCLEIKNNWDYITVSDPLTVISDQFSGLRSHKTFEDLAYTGRSLLFDKVTINQNNRNLYIVAGRYFNGMDSVSIKHFYELNGKTYLREVNLKPETITDGLCNKIWAGTFYNNIISSSNSNRTKLEIINKSIEYEVLTDYTAFLALEREDNSSYGENRDEWLINVDSLLSLESYAIKAYPNPFTDHISLDFNLSNETKNKEYSVQVYDISGRLISETKGNSGSNDLLSLTLLSDYTDLPKGIYFIKVRIERNQQNIKILKN